MSGYSKLFASIIHSTIWNEPLATRVVWVTMIAIADRDGIVEASTPGLARAANVTMEQAAAALASFLGPDPYSRTPDNEGRRIAAHEGGWRILNWDKYLYLKSKDDVREATRDRVRRFRERRGNAGNAMKREVTNVTPPSDLISPHLTSPQTRSDPDSFALLADEPAKPPLVVFPCVGTGAKSWALTEGRLAEWTGAFPGVDVAAESRKALAWVNAKPARRKTARGMPAFLVSWLSRAQNSGRPADAATSAARTAETFEQRDARLRREAAERKAKESADLDARARRALEGT